MIESEGDEEADDGNNDRDDDGEIDLGLLTNLERVRESDREVDDSDGVVEAEDRDDDDEIDLGQLIF